MTPRLIRPRSLDEALEALAAFPGLTLAAGSTFLMPGARELDTVLDLLTVPELKGVREVEGGLMIGATTTFTEIRGNSAVHRGFPMLAAAAGTLGAWQIRNRATLGGNVAAGSTVFDAPPVLLALEAVALVAGPEGRREVPYGDFHVGPSETALGPSEILVGLRLPRPPAGARQRFRKVGTRQGLATGKLTVAMVARVREGYLHEVRIAAGNVASTPLRLRRTETVIRGQRVDERTASLAGRKAAAESFPTDDTFSTAAYRSFALERVVRRMVLSLVQGQKEVT